MFVHGIRGGPFVTWRRVRTPKTLDPATGRLRVAPPEMRHELCWPTVWLKADLPSARLLSLEYAAPASGWEVKHPSDSHQPCPSFRPQSISLLSSAMSCACLLPVLV